MTSHGEQVKPRPAVSHDGIDDWLKKVDEMLDELEEPEPDGEEGGG
jgi:hypothetical protein